MANVDIAKLRASLKAGTATLLVSLVLGAAPSLAQTVEENPPLETGPTRDEPGLDSPADEAIESGAAAQTIVVTGSRITNPNLEQSSPIQTVGEGEIELRQATNAEELISELPGISPGIGNNVNNGSLGFAALNLRALGTNRNLVLLNGTRIVPSAITSETDLNVIPIALIDRVEIVTGGASSVYGADAIAGVANFITKRDFTGIEIVGTLGIAEQGDGERFRTDVTIGSNFDDGRGNVVLSVGYQEVDPVLQGDRDISRTTLGVSGATIGSGTTTPTRVNGPIYDPATGGLRPYNGAQDSFNFAPFNYFQTPLERFNMFGSANYEVTEGVEVYTQAMFTKSTVSLQLAPSGLFLNTFQVPLNNPFVTDAIRNSLCEDNEIGAAACAAAGAATDPTDPNYVEVPTVLARRFVEFGPRETDYVTNQFQIWGGIRGDITEGIDFDIYTTYGESDRTQTNRNWGLTSRVQQSLRAIDETTCADSSNGCVPINLFGSGLDISPAVQDFVDAPNGTTVKTSLSVVNGSISGELGQQGFLFAETPIGFAVGAEYREYTAAQISDIAAGTQDEVLGTGAPSPSYEGSYDVREVFGELIVPIVEDVPFIYSLTAEAGIRYSDYSNTGTSTTWKAGGSYEPVQGVRFRGILQHSVRSPNIGELFLPITTGLSNLSEDPCQGDFPTTSAALRALCIAQGAPPGQIGSIPEPSAGQINATGGGDPNLDVEIADSYTIGVVLSPPQIPRLAVTVDYYHIQVKDAISTATPDDIFGPCFGEPPYQTPPGDPEACSLIGRNPLNGSLNGGGDTLGIFIPLTNQGMLETSGIDVRVNYRLPTSFGGVDFDFSGNWTDELLFQSTPDSIVRECVGQYSVNCGPAPAPGGGAAGEITPEFSFNLRTTVSVRDIADVSLLWRWIDSVRYEDILSTSGIDPDFLEIDSASYLDLSIRTEVNDVLGLTFTVQNLLDRDPPNVSSFIGSTNQNSGNTYPSTYDPIGRFFSITGRLRF